MRTEKENEVNGGDHLALDFAKRLCAAQRMNSHVPAFVTTARSSALMLRTSLPKISGLEVTHHSEKWARVSAGVSPRPLRLFPTSRLSG